jgi:hypothetical protein
MAGSVVAGDIDPLGQRKHALDRFLEERMVQGFTIETRTDTHAIVARRRKRFWSRLQRRDDRYVVEVDEDCRVTMSAAEDLRT